jgi:TetR/AcrR family transcriptional regulator, transcriptional repressor of aconitase
MARVTEAHVEARRNQILDAAWSCFAKRGYHQTTMQDIATDAGISAGAIYRYYASKEAVLAAITERNTERYAELLADIQSESSGPMDVLDAIGQTMLATFEDPLFETNTRLDIEIRPETLRNDVLRERARSQLEFWRKSLVTLLHEARENGELRKDIDIETFVVLAISAYEGLRGWGLIDPAIFRPREVFDLLLNLASSKSLPPTGENPYGLN